MNFQHTESVDMCTVGYHHVYMYIWWGFYANLRDPSKNVYMVDPRKSYVIRKPLVKNVYLRKSFCFKTHDMYIWWNVYMVVPHCSP